MRRIARMKRRLGERGRRQTRKRVNAATKLVDSEISTVRKSAGELLEIAPVKSAIGLLVGTIDNAANFIIDQVEITRKAATEFTRKRAK